MAAAMNRRDPVPGTARRMHRRRLPDETCKLVDEARAYGWLVEPTAAATSSWFTLAAGSWCSAAPRATGERAPLLTQLTRANGKAGFGPSI
jgi:hypothetical protein